MKPKHTDARGFFQELYHFNHDDWLPAQMSWFSIEPEQTRGHHYHTKTYEFFIVVQGSVQFIYGNSDPLADDPQITTYEEGQIIKVIPGDHHAFYSKQGARILVFSSRHFNPDDPDTYASMVTKRALKEAAKAT